ncbi:MAG: hypothetical protein IJF61_03730 [Clostridia bacterium]|nr:hypothetical protein [Clostridia bacterium]
MKRIILIVSIVIIVISGVCWWLFYEEPSHGSEIIYPLSKMKNSKAEWNLSIVQIGNENAFSVSDQQLLYDNKDDLEITFLEDVYMSTPQYFVIVYKNGKEIQNYPILSLEQIKFGTIPYPSWEIHE